MVKDVNIHVKVQDAERAKELLHSVGIATEEMGAKTSRAGGWIKEAFTALVGPLGISAVVGMAVQGVRYYIAALDDMKRAASSAVHDLANTQKAAGNYFEAFNAYSQKDRTAALKQAYGVQAQYGLPLASSMQLLEAQKRSFGEVNPQSTGQFAPFWQLHAGPQTADMIRWMSESGIKTPEQQGNIMRMISAVADQSKLQEEDIIAAISSRSQRFKSMGWSPEQTITNIGKAISGLSPTESSKAMRGMFEGLESFDEAKALEMKAPKNIAASEQARIAWLRTKASGLPAEQRNALMRQAFGSSHPYINKMLFSPTSPELQQSIDYAASPQAAAEEAANAAAYQKTTEGEVEKGAGVAGAIKADTPPIETLRATIRDIGKAHLDRLRYTDRKAYEKITWWNAGEGREQEAAAYHLWYQTLSEEEKEKYLKAAESRQGYVDPTYRKYPESSVKISFDEFSPEEQLSKVQNAANQVNIHYHNDMVYNPVAGTAADRDIGPRVDRDFK